MNASWWSFGLFLGRCGGGVVLVVRLQTWWVHHRRPRSEWALTQFHVRNTTPLLQLCLRQPILLCQASAARCPTISDRWLSPGHISKKDITAALLKQKSHLRVPRRSCIQMHAVWLSFFDQEKRKSGLDVGTFCALGGIIHHFGELDLVRNYNLPSKNRNLQAPIVIYTQSTRTRLDWPSPEEGLSLLHSTVALIQIRKVFA